MAVTGEGAMNLEAKGTAGVFQAESQRVRRMGRGKQGGISTCPRRREENWRGHKVSLTFREQEATQCSWIRAGKYREGVSRLIPRCPFRLL